MITYTDKSVWPVSSEYCTGESPSLADIAVGLGRQSRFAGQTREFYTVLCHSMVTALITPPKYRIFSLIHDASEAIMGDCPTTWKPEQFKALECEVIALVTDHLGLPYEWPDEAVDAVNAADMACLAAEAHVLGHMRAEHYWPEAMFTPMTHAAVGFTQAFIDLQLPYEFLTPTIAIQSYMARIQEALDEYRQDV